MESNLLMDVTWKPSFMLIRSKAMYQGHLREYYKILLIATAGDTRGSRTATYFIRYVSFYFDFDAFLKNQNVCYELVTNKGIFFIFSTAD